MVTILRQRLAVTGGRMEESIMRITEYIAGQTERMANSLAHFIATTPEDRLHWRPDAEDSAPTRSILEQTAECVAVNRLFAALVRTGEAPTGLPSADDIQFANGLDAQEQLVMSAAELANALRAMPEEDLQRTFHHPRAEVLGANLILMGYRNMAYHAGQANLIQMLGGDSEFHVPPMWR